MPITTLTSREFNQDTGRAKRAAKKGPVIITDRGKPVHVLLSIEEYRKLNKKKNSILDALAMPEADEIAFEPRRLKGQLFRPADFFCCTFSTQMSSRR